MGAGGMSLSGCPGILIIMSESAMLCYKIHFSNANAKLIKFFERENLPIQK